jgi:3',5'-cyclic AMP phosphodiesterase CpdA
MTRRTTWRVREGRLIGHACALAALASLWFASATAGDLRIAVVSDFNGSYGSTSYETHVSRAIDAVRVLHPDLVLSTGDMVAGQRLHPPFDRPQLDAMWAAFRAVVVAPLDAAGIAFAATPGNHDASAYAPFVLEREVYRDQWRGRLPARVIDAGDYPFYFAFAVDDALLISLDATVPGALPAEQRAWLRRVLEDAGSRFRWRIVFGHLPIWPLVREHLRDALADPDLEQLLVDAGVTVYLSGHHHAYYPGTHGGLAQIGQACVGAGPRHLIGLSARSPRAITVLDLPANRHWQVHAYTGPQYSTEIPIESLPERIVTAQATLDRLDLSGRAPRARVPATQGVAHSGAE